MDVGDLVGAFESLGDNCEFGLMQRRCGIEPIGFFRWNYAKLESLLRALNNEFSELGTTAAMEISPHPPTREWIVRFPEYGFSYHTHQYEGAVTLDAVRAQQSKVLEFQKRKLLDDLRTSEKIFVRKGGDTLSLPPAIQLHSALRRYGPNTLLWVVPEDEMHRRGTVEVIADGLLKGYIDRYAPYTMAVDLSHVWLDICRHALALWKGQCAIGTVVTGNRAAVSTNLLRREHLENGLGWSGVWSAPSAASEHSTAAGPPFVPVNRVLQHQLVADTTYRSGSIFGYTIPDGLVPTALYVASMFVFIPQDADLDCADVVVAGQPAIEKTGADTKLREVWQRIWTAFRIPSDQPRCALSLYVVGRTGASVRSAGWQLELGCEPTPYVPSDAGGLAPHRSPANHRSSAHQVLS